MSVGTSVRGRGVVRAATALVAAGVLVVGFPGVASASQPGDPGSASSAHPGARPGDLTASSPGQARLVADAMSGAVEDVSQRAGDSQVFANPDGTWTLTQWGGTQWVQTGTSGDSVADWSPVDLTLTRGADGLVRPAVFDGSLTLAAGGAKTDVILSEAIPGSGVTLKLLWDGSELPAARLDRARATYPDVWPGVDLVVEARPTGFEQYFVLKTRASALAHAADLNLAVGVDGGSVVAEASGGLAVLDGSRKVVAEFPVAYAWDASEDDTHVSPVLQPWSAEAHLPAPLDLSGFPMPAATRQALEDMSRGIQEPKSRAVGVSVSGAAHGSRLNLNLDRTWLADPATVYPVIVDPAASYSTNASYDTYVRSAAPNSNYGTDTETRIGSSDGGATKSRSYFAFDTSGIKNLDVLSAVLVLWNYWSATCSPNYWVAYWTAPASSATTWNNPPAYRSVAGVPAYMASTATKGHTSGTTPYCAQDWATLDISPYAVAWATQADNSQGLFLAAPDETSLPQWKRFYSMEAASGNKPHINYIYNRPPGAPTSVTVDGHALSAPLTLTTAEVANGVTVSAVVTDPDGDQVQALFTVKVGGVTVVDSLPGSTVSSGGTSTATLPYVLGAGVPYSLEVRAKDARLMGDVTAPTATFTGPATTVDDIPATDDTNTGVAS